MLVSSTSDPRSTMGEEIKNEKVTPNGRPAEVKPIKMGTDEHEQNGVTVPSNAAIVLAPSPLNLLRIFYCALAGKSFEYN